MNIDIIDTIGKRVKLNHNESMCEWLHGLEGTIAELTKPGIIEQEQKYYIVFDSVVYYPNEEPYYPNAWKGINVPETCFDVIESVTY